MAQGGPLDSPRARRLLVALWIVLVVCLLPVREVIPPDEPRFAHQAQNMLDLGDWVVPRIGDVPFPDKPPVLFWAIDLASLPAGRVTAATARIPSAIGALVVLLLTARLGRRLWGSAAVGAGGALVLLTGVEFFQKAQWVSCDMTMTAFALVALTLWREAAFEEDAGGRPGPRIRVLAGWLAAAAGVLTKGPPALLWPAFWLAGEAAARRRPRPLARLLRPEGPLAFALLVGWWLVAAGRRAGGGYSWNALFTQTVTRYLHAGNSVKPWYFYLYQTPSDLLPWTFLLPAAVACAVLAWRRREDSPALLAARAAGIFLVLGYLFFSGSTGKRGVYVLPAFPILALLAAAAFLEAGRQGGALRREWRDVPLWLTAALGLAITAAPPLAAATGALEGPGRLAGAVGPLEAVALSVSGLALAAGSLAALLASRRARPQEALAAAVLGAAAALLIAGAVGGAAWSRRQGGRAFGARVAAAVPEGERIAIERDKFELILFYSGRRGTECETDEALLAELESGRARYAILRSGARERLRAKTPLDSMQELFAGRLGGSSYVALGPP